MPAEMQQTFYVENAMRKVESKMRPFMARLATTYASEVKLLMKNSPATGKIYKRGGKMHRASAPGEPPAPDTGNLIRHIQWRVWNDGNHWFAGVGNTLPYSLYLEYGAARGTRYTGGKNAGRLKSIQWVLFPRPAWAPAMIILRRKIPMLMRAGSGLGSAG